MAADRAIAIIKNQAHDSEAFRYQREPKLRKAMTHKPRQL
jgi:hypothetical protein